MTSSRREVYEKKTKNYTKKKEYKTLRDRENDKRYKQERKGVYNKTSKKEKKKGCVLSQVGEPLTHKISYVTFMACIGPKKL